MLFDKNHNTDLTKIKLKIKGMHCVSCALLIDSDLEDTEGIKCSITSYAKSETEIEFDKDKIEIDKIIKVIDKSGYKVATD